MYNTIKINKIVNPNSLLCRNRDDSNRPIEFQGNLKSQNNLEKEQSWKAHISQCQNLLQS